MITLAATVVIVLALKPVVRSAGLACGDVRQFGLVDWSILYKHDDSAMAQAIMANANPTWNPQPINLLVVTNNNPLTNTMNLVFGQKAQNNIIAYSDFPPYFRQRIDFGSASRGFLAWQDSEGIWMVHNLPRWPDMHDIAYNPTSLPSESKAALIVCVTTPYVALFSLGENLITQQPIVFYWKDANASPTLSENANFKHLTQKAIFVYSPYGAHFSFVTTFGAFPISSLSKAGKMSLDFYSVYVTMVLQSNLVVHSSGDYMKKLLPSVCNKKYTVENVIGQSLQINNVKFERLKSNTRWAITTGQAKKIFCAGAGDRTVQQLTIPAGLTCIENNGLNELFAAIAATGTIEKC